jgi:hypothetical protein
MKHSDHGILGDEQAQEQPANEKRAQSAHRTDAKRSATREATRDPKLTDGEKARGAENVRDNGRDSSG